MQRDLSNEFAAERLTDLAHLASGIGHHVINAFSAIVSNAEILRLSAEASEPIDPESVADLIVKTAVEAASVARRLIDYTRPITAVGPQPVALDRLIETIVDKEKPLRDPSISWQVDARSVPTIRGDEHRLQAMIGHIIDNAVEALPPLGGTIVLATSLDARGWVVLDVRDSGGGMTLEILQHAVEPFFSTKGSHFGVGLTIAHGIWRRHRGTLSLRSQPGEGTQVRLLIDPDVANESAPSRR
jgi:two-component system, NtrC family, sensor kinase